MMCRNCSTNWKEAEFIQDFGGKQEGKRPLERLRHRCEDNIKRILDKQNLTD
jgi:hypothetical protein